MRTLSFLLQYILKPRTTGAVLPSSRFLARKMVAGIDFGGARCIVEYGPGTGVFTEKLLERKNDATVLILLERNAEFCKTLREKFAGRENLFIYEDSAETIGAKLAAHGFSKACYIVSGLPFASLPPQVSEGILTQTREYLSDSGKFITFQYTLFKKKMFLKYFKKFTATHEMRNIPPAYVLAFEGERNENTDKG